MRAKLSGLHTAIKKRRDGVTIYAYAFRGGPLVARAEGATLAIARSTLERQLGEPDTLTAIAKARRPIPIIRSTRRIDGLVTAWLASDHFARLSEKTRIDYRRVADQFRDEFAEYPVAAFEEEALDDLIGWRNEKRSTPRAADYRMAVVGALFAWARAERLTTANPTADIVTLHRADRSEAIWTVADLQRLYTKGSPQLRQAVELACLTGLRLGDLVRLTWDRVTEEAITIQTGKSRGRRTALVPLFPATHALLDEIGRREVGAVLLSSKGKPWTADGLKTAFRRAKDDAGITGLRFHDLRGTAATRFKLLGLDEDDIALILGWSPESVRSLLIRYVSADAVAVDMLRRITERTGRYKPTDKPAQIENIETARKSKRSNEKSP